MGLSHQKLHERPLNGHYKFGSTVAELTSHQPQDMVLAPSSVLKLLTRPNRHDSGAGGLIDGSCHIRIKMRGHTMVN